MGDARGGKRTPIDLVMEHGGAPDAPAAAKWLCDRIGIKPETLGWRCEAHGSGEEPKAAPQQQQPTARLFYFADCDKAIVKAWLLKGLIAAGESSSWIGPPGSGKSAILTAIAVYIALGGDWRGFRNRAQKGRGVLYLAFERGVLVRRRLAAYKRQGFVNLPIAVREGCIDLLSPSCVDIIRAAIKEAEAHLGETICLVIDTFGKGIALGGGNENDAKDQNRAFANLQALRDQTGVHTAEIHHTGKDETRGPRGSNAMLGDVDLLVQISGKGRVKVATATKANDQAEGELFQFTIRSADLGTDEDGDPITVGIVDDTEPAATQATEWPAGSQDFREAFFEALLDSGFDHAIGNGPTVRAAHLDAVRNLYRSRFVDAVKDDTKRPHRKADWSFQNKLGAAKGAGCIAGALLAGRQIIWASR